ncbi:hypothetical protein FBT64_05315, partial [Shigella flexneri]
MTEIQRLLTETIESLNTREKRDNKLRCTGNSGHYHL